MGIKKKLVELYEERDISKMNGLFERSFAEYFTLRGYSFLPPASLISQEDSSVIFTCAPTNSFKRFVVSDEFQDTNGYFQSQACLRTQALVHAFDDLWLPFGQAYFHISSALSRPGRLEEMLEEVGEFTLGTIGIAQEDIFLKSSSHFPTLRGVHKHTPIRVEYDSEEGDYYVWKFGLENMTGEGLTICLRNPNNGRFLDVGNIINLLDRDRELRGHEFGYGHEFLMSTVVGIDNPLALSPIFAHFSFEPGLSSKYYGYMEAVSRIKDAKEDVKVRMAVKKIYKKYLKALKHTGKRIGKSDGEILNELFNYCQKINSGRGYGEFLQEKRVINGFEIK